MCRTWSSPADNCHTSRCDSKIDKISRHSAAEDHLNSFEPRSGSPTDKFLHRSSSMQPECPSYKELSPYRSMQNDDINSVSFCDGTGNRDDYFSLPTIPEQIASNSSSVRWEEKTEIVEPGGHQGDMDNAPEILSIDSGMCTQVKEPVDLHGTNHTDIHHDHLNMQKFSDTQFAGPELQAEKGMIYLQKIDNVKTLGDDACALSTVAGSENNEIESEVDTYMDAMNSIGSESEYSFNFQTGQEVSRYFSVESEEKVESMYKHMAHSSERESSCSLLNSVPGSSDLPNSVPMTSSLANSVPVSSNLPNSALEPSDSVLVSSYLPNSAPASNDFPMAVPVVSDLCNSVAVPSDLSNSVSTPSDLESTVTTSSELTASVPLSCNLSNTSLPCDLAKSGLSQSYTTERKTSGFWDVSKSSSFNWHCILWKYS